MSVGAVDGALYPLRGLCLLTEPRIRKFVFVPLAVNTALFAVGLIYFGNLIDTLFDGWLPDTWQWVRWLIWPVFAALGLAVVLVSFVLVANLLAAPFNGLLASAVGTHLGAASGSDEQGNLAKRLLTDIGMETRKFGFFAVLALPLALLFLIPGLQLIAGVCWFVFGCWVLAHEYTDYPLAIRGITFAAQRTLLSSRQSLVFGFGLGVMVLTLCPLINFLAMPAAVAGATILCHEHFPEGSNEPGLQEQ